MKSIDYGESWSVPLNISSSTNDCYAPSIAIDNKEPNGLANIWVFWHKEINPDSSVIFYRVWKAEDSSWTDAPSEFSSSNKSSFYTSVFGSTEGVYLMWTGVTDVGDTNVFYSKYSAPDVEMDSIIIPVGNIPDTATIPEGIVKNNSDEALTIYAKCWITGPDTNYEEENERGSLIINPSDTIHVIFPEWTPGEPGDSYEVKMRVYLDMSGEIELNKDNNELTDSCTVAYSHDIQAEEIISPVEDTVHIGDSVDITSSFSNQGLSDEINVPCAYYIYKDGNPVTFSTSSIDTLLVDEIDTVDFTPWVPEEVGTYNLYVVTSLSTEENPENDTLIDTLVVTEQGLSSIIYKKEIVWDPVDKIVNIKGMKGTIFNMYNIAGINVKKVNIESSEQTIELYVLPKGIYFIEMKDGKFKKSLDILRIIIY